MKWSPTWKAFKAKTPMLMVKFGNALILISGLSSMGAWFADYPDIGLALAITGIVGRILISFFHEEKKEGGQL